MTEMSERAVREDDHYEAERFEVSQSAEVEQAGDQLEDRIRAASAALRRHQQEDGHWCFEFEADATIPAEYILLTHYLGEEPNPEREAKIGAYLRRIQGKHGGWPLFHEGAFDMSASVKAYFALKMIGDDINAPHMLRARQAILARGGAEMSNVFTRILLALYGVVTWRAAPVMPVEIMLLPKWFPFHMTKVSYWARTVMIPLYVLAALKPAARNKRGVTVAELFLTPPKTVGMRPRAEHQDRSWFWTFAAIDKVLRVIEPLFPARTRRIAIEKAVAFVKERLNGEDGLGAIFPAMANSVMMFDALRIPESDPDRAIARYSVDKLLLETDNEIYCQPCVSPVWDTGLAAQSLLEAGGEAERESAIKGLEWLKPRQVLDVKGDWAAQRPDVRPGGWAFQYANPHYPDLDDTAVVVMAYDRAANLPGNRQDYGAAISRGREWISGLQSKNGGWASFDADNTHMYLNNIPFSDHGALLRPADSRRKRALRVNARPARREARNEPHRQTRRRLPSERPGEGWKLVRPLGHELYLRHVVGALRAERRRRKPFLARHAARRGLAYFDPKRGWGLGRGWLKLQARLQRLRKISEHGVANVMGASGADGRR